ncbi:MAG: type II toxin-antitoxin system VapC family toxin [Pleurocapsa minor GSE-CHR-MK-17-07R]|nr:type II toxin-antitoxin system VapC family toxin [Pleurocapsa minor GSE-CHR-MK 17-07R]
MTGVAGSRFLLDTNAIIALQRENAALTALLRPASDVFLPVIAVGELYFGAYKSQRVEENRRAVAAFIANRVVLKVDTDTTDVFGQVKQQLRAKGRPIPENDIWIAALAIQHDLTLISNDEHFSELDNLTWRSW